MTMTLADLPVAPGTAALSRPLERLEAEIVELSSQLTAATSRLLVLVGEFDAVEGWREWGMRSTAHWLSWQCGVGLTAGREQVRVARVLRNLPLLAGEFAAGRLSYSKVRAVSRVATAETESTLVGWAVHATAAQLDRLVAAQRRVTRTADVRARHDARYLTWRWDDDGSLIGSFRLPPEQAGVLLQALQVAKDELPAVAAAVEDTPAEAHPTDPADTPAEASSPRSVDALVQIATGYLDGRGDTASANQQQRYQLVLHATTEQLARDDDAAADGVTTDAGIRLHPETARRLSCDCPTSSLTVDGRGNPLHLGRRTRRIRGRVARAVRYRDGGRCQAPGCTNAATISHHIRHWARGGPTCLINLISLCDCHHWLVHDGGWSIAVIRPGVWRFYAPDGRRLDTHHTPARASRPLPVDPTIQPDAVTGLWAGEPLHIGYATAILNEETVGRAGLEPATKGL
jgi:hypothetical protein